jgi:hypothetical protein
MYDLRGMVIPGGSLTVDPDVAPGVEEVRTRNLAQGIM